MDFTRHPLPEKQRLVNHPVMKRAQQTEEKLKCEADVSMEASPPARPLANSVHIG